MSLFPNYACCLHNCCLHPQPFDQYNASVTISLAYANGTRGNALRSVNYPSPIWGVLFWPSAELVDITATVQVSNDDDSFVVDEQGRALLFVVYVLGKGLLLGCKKKGAALLSMLSTNVHTGQ